MEYKVCAKCGKYNETSRLNCLDCGEALSVNSIVQVDPIYAPPPPPNSAQPQAEMLFCPRCGQSTQGTGRFCGRCGFDLTSLGPKIAKVENLVKPIPAKKKFSILAGGVAGMLGGFITILAWFSPWLGLGMTLPSLLNFLRFSTFSGVSGFEITRAAGDGVLLAIGLGSLVGSSGTANSLTAIVVVACLVVILYFLAIPLTGIEILKSGYWLLRNFILIGSGAPAHEFLSEAKLLEKIHNHAITGFVLMFLLFLLFIWPLHFPFEAFQEGFFWEIGSFIALWIVCGLLRDFLSLAK